MSSAEKDTIYIDVDDEITSIIDKVQGSKHKIVALVLPKRAAMLQSIVNMKLLKRAGTKSKKQIVLITSEAGLLPLAGAVHLHVAKTLQSKPAIPSEPDVADDSLALDAEDEPELEAPELDQDKSIGELAGDASGAAAAGAFAAKAVTEKPIPEDTIELDDTDEVLADGKDKKTGKKDKKLKIPNFDKFRTRILLGGGVFVLLLVLWYIAAFVLPSARITIKTDNISVNTDVSFSVNTATKTLDADKSAVPAVIKEVKKTDAEKVPATGKKNVGEVASGSVTLHLTDCSKDSVTVPAGTTVSSNGLNFVTQRDVSLSSYQVKIGGVFQCMNSSHPEASTGSSKVVAGASGDQYNLNERDYSVAGFGNVSAHGGSMSGGTTKNITVVSAADIDGAKQKMADRTKAAATTELKAALETDNKFALIETITNTDPAITSSPNINEEAADVTVTSITTYQMLGVAKGDLQTLVENAAKKQFDTSKQKISDDGLDKATFKLVEKKSATEQNLSLQSTVNTGTQIDQAALKKEIAGKKGGDVQQIIGVRPGVKEVSVKYSPFWVYKTPSKTSRITLVFEQNQTDAKSN